MYIVTGAAGFIGSNVVKALNDRGVPEIVAVDDFSGGTDVPNLAGCSTVARIDKREFRKMAESGNLPWEVAAILHQGACADTMETDRAYMFDSNVEYSKVLLHYCTQRGIPFVYASSASVYGVNRESEEIPANESPINVYAESKLAFDNYLRSLLSGFSSTVVGLRYFNVYGPREARKGRMASMAFQINRQLREKGMVKLFTGTDGFSDGEQARDFVHVDDVVGVNFFFMDGPVKKGIFNVGTGTARSFNDVANVQILRMGKGHIEYVPFPDVLKGKYQSFTEANLQKLLGAGYSRTFMPIEDGLAKAIPAWAADEEWNRV